MTQFQVLTVVRLTTPDPRPPDGPDDDRIQGEHLAYLRGLAEQGKIALNGPIRAVDSPDWRGLTVYTVDVDEARALASADPRCGPAGSTSWSTRGGSRRGRSPSATAWT